MRLNLPITQQEREIDAYASIVCQTDIKGCITYVNPAFVAISGFTEQELLGAPQNIVRHPDMPEVVFGDMWNTLRSGLPWSGLVKNRCKNGDFYWVRTNVTPTWERGVCSGYMAVCTWASRADIDAADKAYCKLEKEYARISAQRGKADPLRRSMPAAILLVARAAADMARSMMRAVPAGQPG
ncbi:PAS domain-containing protein [Herbaspirillum sp. NPDC087042]|uniref:PAS domain-containing protein n=1 Tax=Herbaspirillum sp. NPDC087042 TaxID=3364004 RepID=UPI0038248139